MNSEDRAFIARVAELMTSAITTALFASTDEGNVDANWEQAEETRRKIRRLSEQPGPSRNENEETTRHDPCSTESATRDPAGSDRLSEFGSGGRASPLTRVSEDDIVAAAEELTRLLRNNGHLCPNAAQADVRESIIDTVASDMRRLVAAQQTSNPQALAERVVDMLAIDISSRPVAIAAVRDVLEEGR